MNYYEQKYKATLEQARDYHSRCQTEEAKRELEAIFPQLRESEDERIRKNIRLALLSVDDAFWKTHGLTAKDAIAWLEKQKEQKPEELSETQELEVIEKHITNDSISCYVNDRLEKCGWHVTEQKPADDNPLDDPRFTDGFDSGRAVQKIFDEPSGWSEIEPIIMHLDNLGNTAMADILRRYRPSIQEWSEEDEHRRQQTINALDRNGYHVLVDWLKSLRPQKDCSACSKNLEGYINGRVDAEKKLLDQFGAVITPEHELHMKPRWKPSEEQLWNLRCCFDKNEANAIPEVAILQELYEQLKKLM